jgi:two-component system nitrogen regulation sensor histidine kinase NtrY
MTDLPSFANRSPKNGSRTRRIILISIGSLIVALIATQKFWHQTSVGSPRFVRMSLILWSATVLVILALLILGAILGRNLIKLYFERKSRQVGSFFKSRMVRIFVVLSLMPAILLFLLAYELMSFSIERWFSAPAQQLMDDSRKIATQYYEETRQQANTIAGTIAAALTADALRVEERELLARKLEEACDRFRFESARLYNDRGRAVVESGRAVVLGEHQPTVEKLIGRAKQGLIDTEIERADKSDPLREVIWSVAPVHDHAGRVIGTLLTETIRSPNLSFHVARVEEAYKAYEELQQEKQQLRVSVLLILFLSTVLIVFSFSWFAMYLAKRITVPIKALAEGAAAVATGDLKHRVTCEAMDELGSLVSSFNQMTADLQENKDRIEAAQDNLRQSNVELDNRRRYIEAILQTIATGVIALDSNYRIRTMNPAAMQMFGVQHFGGDAPLDQVLSGPASDALRVLLHKSTVLGPVMRNLDLSLTEKTLHVATTVTPLVDSAGQRTGWVVVLDDVTELLRVEKMAAWQEVARRLAHEIKNPLTPIQLSAERVLRRYKQIVASAQDGQIRTASWQQDFSAFSNLLDECTRTILQESGSLKSLVDEFSRFARMPQIRLEDADLHQVLDNTLGLYNGRISDVRVLKSYGTDVPMLRIDPDQMKRVFINLFDNALEAMVDTPQHKVLQIRTSCNSQNRSIRIEISDTGRGFPKEYQDSVFLPYFSTRKGGSGLGLAIVRQIITDHHGYVHAEPSMPVGTRIVIDLPLAAA